MNHLPDLSDEELMNMYIQGDSKGFEIIYNRYHKKIYSYLRKRLSGEDNINEVFQNTFLKFHRFRDKYNPKYSLMSWIYIICRSEMIDYFKRKKLTTTPFDETYHSLVENNSEIIDLDKYDFLNEKERKAIELRYFSESSFEEISNNLNTSIVNSRKIISRALMKIRNKIKGVKA